MHAATLIPHSLYDEPGPFATVYIDASRTTEHAAKEFDNRWRALRDELAGSETPTQTVEALEQAVGGHRDHGGERGQMLVAAGGRVLLDRALPAPPRRSIARRAPLPHLMPYLAQLADEVPHVVVVADRSGADILIADPVGLVAEESVEGSHQHPLHKTSTEEWSTLHFQHRVENAWAENARDVAAEVAHRVRRLGAELVVVAGDERERTLITDGLAKQLPKGVDAVGVDAGGRAAGSSTEALAGAVHEAVLDRVREQRDQALEKLREAVGRHDGAVTDTPAVCEALRRAQVASIVLRDDPASTAMSWVGPEPLQLGLSADEVAALGVDQPVQDRLDAAIVRALVYSDADLVVSPELPPPATQGVAALLRYTDAATPTG